MNTELFTDVLMVCIGGALIVAFVLWGVGFALAIRDNRKQKRRLIARLIEELDSKGKPK